MFPVLPPGDTSADGKYDFSSPYLHNKDLHSVQNILKIFSDFLGNVSLLTKMHLVLLIALIYMLVYVTPCDNSAYNNLIDET